MPVTALDEKTALVVIDLQNGIVSGRPERIAVVEKARQLGDAFREHGLPVVWVNAIGGGSRGRTDDQARARARAAEGGGGRARPARAEDFAELVTELNAQPADHRVTKRTWGAFTGTDLEDYLKSNNVTQIVLAGIATSAGVESTARQAHERNYNVTIATDAMTDGNAELHTNCLTRVFPRFSESGATSEILALLGSR